MGIFDKLANIQAELKAPKGQYNSFGKYNYRSCEDILEAVKPLLKANKCTLTIADDLVNIGERYYIKATAILTDLEDNNPQGLIANTAYAREAEAKAGMDVSQITGTASSYARKYALNGLFLIDDTKDADATEAEPKADKKASDKQIELMRTICKEQNLLFDEAKAKAMTSKQASAFIDSAKGGKK